MTTFARLAPCFLLVGSVSVGLCCLKPAWAEAVGLDLWNLPSTTAAIEAETARSDDLDAQQAEVLERLAVKHEIAEQLLAGRLSLSEAAARFRDLTPRGSLGERILRAAYPGAGDDECFCRAVINWVGSREASPSTAHEARVRQLEAELEGRLGRGGKVMLQQ
jgi:hypothetical protein